MLKAIGDISNSMSAMLVIIGERFKHSRTLHKIMVSKPSSWRVYNL